MKGRIVLALIASIAVLTGCSSKPQLAGAAAVVGDVRLAQKDVSSQVAQAQIELANIPASNGVEIPTTKQVSSLVVNRFVIHQLLSQISQKNPEYAPSKKEIDSVRKEAEVQYGATILQQALLVNNGIIATEIDTFVGDVVTQRKIVTSLVPSGDENAQGLAIQKLLLEEAKSLGVQIAPRYGAWDVASLQIIPGENVLSFPASPRG